MKVYALKAVLTMSQEVKYILFFTTMRKAQMALEDIRHNIFYDYVSIEVFRVI